MSANTIISPDDTDPGGKAPWTVRLSYQ